jgi:hypothetical protein
MVVKDFAEFGHDPFELAKGRGHVGPLPVGKHRDESETRVLQFAALILAVLIRAFDRTRDLA